MSKTTTYIAQAPTAERQLPSQFFCCLNVKHGLEMKSCICIWCPAEHHLFCVRTWEIWMDETEDTASVKNLYRLHKSWHI